MSKITSLEFAINYLRINRHADFEEVSLAAEKEGIDLQPITFGRAQQLKGVVPDVVMGDVEFRQFVRRTFIRYYAPRIAILLMVIAAVVWFFLRP